MDDVSKIDSILSDSVTYTAIGFNNCTLVKTNANSLIFNLMNNGLVTRKQYIHLTLFTAKCPVFMLFPKFINHPFRPMVSQINGRM